MTPEREISIFGHYLDRLLKLNSSYFDAKVEAEKERDQLRENLAIAMDALDWYADKKNWVLKLIKSTSGGRAEKLQDRGKIAKQALSKIRGEK